MSPNARTMKNRLSIAATSLAVFASTASGVHAGFIAPSYSRSSSSIGHLLPMETQQWSGLKKSLSFGGGRGALRMSSADDEVAELRAAAQKAREEAAALAKQLGKDIDTDSSSETTATTKVAAAKQLSKDEAMTLSSKVDFDAGDASSQTDVLDAMVKSGDFSLWKSATAISQPTPLRPYPVSLDMLERRTNGKITGASLGVNGDMEVTLDDFKDLTIAITLGSTILAIAALAILPENIGAAVCYLIALVPVGFIAVGSTAPGIIAGAISSSRGTADDNERRDDRICRHEAGHFLCGYLCGLPVKQYSIVDDTGFPCVEFHPTSEGDYVKREFTSEEIAALAVVAMSGSVAEVLSFGQAKGGENDLLELDGLMRRSKEFVGAQKQQDLTRWGALAAYNLIKANLDKYEGLVQAFKEKSSVAECVAAIEGK